MSEQTPQAFAPQAQQLLAALNQVIYGKEQLMRTVVASFLAGGHVLLEGLPGLGKTVLARSFAAMTGLTGKRIQFTPDLMPADITGTHILEDSAQGKQMRFVPGPVFCNFLLADEINRASPKTQAALLEAMAESRVTQMGETRQLEPPFFVMATQNPIEMEGTNPLPEAQLDRFAVKIDVPNTDEATLLKIIQERKDGNPPPVTPVMDRAAVVACQGAVDQIHIPEAVAKLIARVVSRTTPELCSQELHGHLRFGSSPRGAIWLARIAKALALLDGRPGAGFEDVLEAAPSVLGHRLILTYSARLDGIAAKALVIELVKQCEREILAT